MCWVNDGMDGCFVLCIHTKYIHSFWVHTRTDAFPHLRVISQFGFTRPSPPDTVVTVCPVWQECREASGFSQPPGLPCTCRMTLNRHAAVFCSLLQEVVDECGDCIFSLCHVAFLLESKEMIIGISYPQCICPMTDWRRGPCPVPAAV